MPLLLIQHIHTQWTKNSRGGQQAQLRAKMPARWALPSIDPASAASSSGLHIIHQCIQARERDDFSPTTKVTVTDHDKGDRISLTLCEVTFATTAKSVAISYRYHPMLGAPDRPSHARSVFELAHHQWGLITANGRSAWEDTWSYDRHIIHLGFYQHGLPPGDLRMPPANAHFTHQDEHALR